MHNYFKDNESLWNDWASFHPETTFYDMEAFRAGASSLKSIERDALGDVQGKSLLHLQCHFGQDTLSWARMGASVVGVDFSATAIEKARTLNKELGLSAEFVHSNVLELSGKLNRQFDIVYTSYGTIVWLPELETWGKIIADHLKPGGTFYMAEFHPGMYMFDFEKATYAYSYFNTGTPYTEQANGSYAKPDEGGQRTEHTWSHSLAEVFNALLSQGLQVVDFQEYAYSPYDCFPNMEEIAPGKFQCKALRGAPHLFGLKVKKL
jgi:2-polyprenyl-3-methyl-5-hydroxy-6-metoxy-1,4-benzoquinol methylase